MNTPPQGSIYSNLGSQLLTKITTLTTQKIFATLETDRIFLMNYDSFAEHFRNAIDELIKNGSSAEKDICRLWRTQMDRDIHNLLPATSYRIFCKVFLDEKIPDTTKP